MHTYTSKDIHHNKETTNSRGSRRIFPGFIAFVDCTEQQIPRPVDKNKRKMYYSGKKKKHTVKNQIMINNRGFILHKTTHKKGHRHDYDVYKKNPL